LALVQLVGSAQHLLYVLVPAAYAVLQSSPIHNSFTAARGGVATAAAGSSTRAEEDQMGAGRDMYMLLHTGWQRLLALQRAAAGRGSTTCMQTSATTPAIAIVMHPTTTPKAAGEGSSRGAAGTSPAAELGQAKSEECGVSAHAVFPTWCPAHAPSLAPSALLIHQAASGLPSAWSVLALWRCMGTAKARLQLLPGCCYEGCTILNGPSEAGLVSGRRGVVCSGCGVVRYCCAEHARGAWPAHSKVCGRLAASRGPSQTLKAIGQPTAAGDVFACQAAAAAAGAGVGAVHASSSDSSSGDTVPVRDCAPVPPSSSQLCAWCGKTGPVLLRCARCKAVRYCGADHQRAAWKAGHKKECGV
jgi:hypothetical protein